jgi:hypothetical protein
MQSTIKRNLAGAAEQTARAVAIPQQTQAEMMRAQAAAQNAANNATKVQLQIKAAQQLGGLDPRAAGNLNAAMRNLQAQVTTDRQARDALNNQWTKLMAIPGATSPGSEIGKQIKNLQDQASQVNSRLSGEQQQLDQFSNSYKHVIQTEQRAMGAPNSWSPQSVSQTSTWQTGNGKSVKVTSTDGGLTWTPDGHHFYNAQKQPVAPSQGQ